MNEKNQETLMVIAKPKKTPKEKLKWQIESDLFYLVECWHCETVFLIEESIDDGREPEFVVPCPRCFNHNTIKKGENRLKLRLEKIMGPEEMNPYIERVSKKIKVEGIDY